MAFRMMRGQTAEAPADAVVEMSGTESGAERIEIRKDSDDFSKYRIRMPWLEKKDDDAAARIGSYYEAALAEAARCGCKSIAFPLPEEESDGVPREEWLRVVTDVFQRFLERQEMEILLAAPGGEEAVFGEAFGEIRAFVADRCGSSRGEETPTPAQPQPSFEQGAPGPIFPQAAVPPVVPLPIAPAAKPSRKRFSAAKRRATAKKETESLILSNSIPDELSLDERLRSMYTDSFEKHLQQLINKKGMNNSQVYAAANISKQYFSRLMKGQIKPSKEKVLALAVGLKLNLDETVDFLRMAGYALSPVSQTDVIVEYFIRKQDYSVIKIDIALFDYGLPPLSEPRSFAG